MNTHPQTQNINLSETRKTRKTTIFYHKSVPRPRFNTLTPNRELTDCYKDSSVRQSQQIRVSSWHLKGLVLGNGDRVKGSKRGGILSTKVSITVTMPNQQFTG